MIPARRTKLDNTRYSIYYLTIQLGTGVLGGNMDQQTLLAEFVCITLLYFSHQWVSPGNGWWAVCRWFNTITLGVYGGFAYSMLMQGKLLATLNTHWFYGWHVGEFNGYFRAFLLVFSLCYIPAVVAGGLYKRLKH